MQRPIDLKYVSTPIKSKYVAEETADMDYWVLGSKQADGATFIFVSSGANEDVFRNVPFWKARLLVEARNRWVEENLRILNSEAG